MRWSPTIEAEFVALFRVTDNKTLAARWGVSPDTVEWWARKQGITKDAAYRTGVHRHWAAKMRQAKVGQPVGAETRLKLSIAGLGRKHTQTACEKISAGRSEYLMKNKWASQWANIHAGRAADLGDTWFRSAWERNVCRYLNHLKEHGWIKDFTFEKERLEFPVKGRGTRNYIPDFIVTTSDGSKVYFEVKGRFDKRTVWKLGKIAATYPDLKLGIIEVSGYRWIEQHYAGLLPHWEYDRWHRRAEGLVAE